MDEGQMPKAGAGFSDAMRRGTVSPRQREQQQGCGQHAGDGAHRIPEAPAGQICAGVNPGAKWVSKPVE
jgi:hypothetical protein